jgi:hypothetical protein
MFVQVTEQSISETGQTCHYNPIVGLGRARRQTQTADGRQTADEESESECESESEA